MKSNSKPPRCPRHLSPMAKKFWRKHAREFHRLGKLTQLDRLAFELLCDAYAHTELARKQMEATGGMILTDEKTG